MILKNESSSLIIKQEAKKDGAVVRQDEETKINESVASSYE